MSRGGRAVVVGAGICGVVVAQALADRFRHVLVVERDPEVKPRPHVPHLAHTHILGAHGYRLLCRQFDGLAGDLERAGAPLFDYGQCPFYTWEWAPRGSFGLVSRSCTRPLLETLLRRRLLERSNVELVTKRQATDFVMRDGRVRAVRFADKTEVEADLVVDAAGLGSKTPAWLERHGFPTPTKCEVDLHGALVSQLFRPAPGRGNDWVIMFVRRSPGNTRQGAISWVEDGLWRVSIWGVGGMRPPPDLPGLLAFAREMATPDFHEALEDAEPVSPPSVYGNSWSQWIHYEQLARFPEGLVVVGDAMFHPNYEHAQGMTFCAMTADLLGEHLDRSPSSPGWSLEFQRKLGALNAPWWDWNLAAELKVAKVTTNTPVTHTAALRHRYYRTVRELAIRDEVLWKAVLEVNQGARLPASLFRPSIMGRVIGHRARRHA